MAPTLYIGQSSFKGPFANYFAKMNFLELLAEPHRLPKLQRLNEYREQAPADFQFSVVLSPRALEDDAAGKQLLDYGVQVASTVKARWLVLRTPPSVRPGGSTERGLAARFAALAQRLPECALAWEPRGLWEGQRFWGTAQQLGVQAVCDVRDIAPGPQLYARLLRVGTGARTNTRVLERLALALLQSEAAYVVVDGGPAMSVRQELEAILQDALDEQSEDDADDLNGGDADDLEDDDAEGADDDLEDDDEDELDDEEELSPESERS